MNTILQIILIEAAVFALIMILAIYYVGSRRKKARLAGIDQLVNEINKKESQRKQQIIDFLVDNCQLGQQQAEESSKNFIDAERLFMYQFIEQQLKQTSLADFYTQVCDLLEKYLGLLALDKMQSPAAPEPEVEVHPETDIIKESSMQETDVKAELNPPANQELLAEQNDENVSAIDEGMQEDNSVDDDLDWNDAFAEAGSGMETTEQQTNT